MLNYEAGTEHYGASISIDFPSQTWYYEIEERRETLEEPAVVIERQTGFIYRYFTKEQALKRMEKLEAELES